MSGIRVEESSLLPSVVVKAAELGRQYDTWRKHYFHLSDAIDCIKKISYRVQGYEITEPPDAESLMAWMIGAAVHSAIQDSLVNEGLLERGDIEIPIEDEEANLIGKADAIIWADRLKGFIDRHKIEISEEDKSQLDEVGEQRVLLELKTKKDKKLASGESSFEKYTKEPEKGHIVQAQGYMFYLNLDYCWITYLNKNDNRMQGFFITKDIEIGQFIRDKALMVKDYAEKKELPPRPYQWKVYSNTDSLSAFKECEGWPSKDKKGAWVARCQWFSVCWSERLKGG